MGITPTTGLLIVISVALLGFTAWTLAEAECRRRHLKSVGINGDRRLYVNRVVRHELFRFIKHLIITTMIIATACEIPRLLEFRNVGIMSVAGLLGLNSALDLYDRRRGLRGYLRAEGTSHA